MVAEILAVDSDPFIHQVVIDRGERNGVFEGQPVVNDQGVVGQVIAAGKTTSRVLLITDLSHAIPVRIMRNDICAIAGGTGQLDELMLKNAPRSADVREGDLLVTSGLGGRFPMGYPVAKVTRVASEEGVYLPISRRRWPRWIGCAICHCCGLENGGGTSGDGAGRWFACGQFGRCGYGHPCGGECGGVDRQACSRCQAGHAAQDTGQTSGG